MIQGKKRGRKTNESLALCGRYEAFPIQDIIQPYRGEKYIPQDYVKDPKVGQER